MLSALLSLLLLSPAPSAPRSSDPGAILDAAAAKLDPAEIEDDLGGSDEPLKSVRTQGCETTIETAGKSHRVDWKSGAYAAPGDTFVFVQGPGVKLAIVGDVSRPDQAMAFATMLQAMVDLSAQCNGRAASK